MRKPSPTWWSLSVLALLLLLVGGFLHGCDGCGGGGGGGGGATTVTLNVGLGVGGPGPVTPFCAEATGSGPGTLDSGKVLEEGLVADSNGNITINFFGGITTLTAGSWQWSYLQGQATMNNYVYSCPSSTPMYSLGSCGRQIIANQTNLVTMTKTVGGMVCQ